LSGVVCSHPGTAEPAGMTPSGTCYRLVVAGRLSHLLVDTIDARFGAAASIRPSGSDTAVQLVADQPSLRALLTLLWDVGHEVVAVTACTAGPERNESRSR
jgi:hypothetical protein